ncbi:MAG: CRISPR-associated endoribonuclease Cas2 [uncultured Thiotrichaceae bacterium]|uniref:CRISPR-associated endoribonuclease Cas2 n=1 Tax=uncultured Thiotrichaceae bacterium TaxID=298394 RepID=A0A6S6TMA9_9GAMM|nr:MAG: CRISPR-associated endoribonuclease Cas2 [uncultured Thiotrichaceae bacterium]
MKSRQLYLLSYDISEAKRLRATLKCVRAYATGGQKSVHECWLSDAEKGDLLATLSQIIDESTDSLIIIRLDPRQKTHALGRGIVIEDPDWFYLG